MADQQKPDQPTGRQFGAIWRCNRLVEFDLLSPDKAHFIHLSPAKRQRYLSKRITESI
jgi:hypothetical protein